MKSRFFSKKLGNLKDELSRWDQLKSYYCDGKNRDKTLELDKFKPDFRSDEIGQFTSYTANVCIESSKQKLNIAQRYVGECTNMNQPSRTYEKFDNMSTCEKMKYFQLMKPTICGNKPISVDSGVARDTRDLCNVIDSNIDNYAEPCAKETFHNYGK